MTVVNPKSISGINSITTGSGSDNLLTIHTSDASNTERFRIDSTGTTKIVTGIVTTLTATTGIVTTLTSNTTTLNSTTTATGNINISGANITLQDSGGASDDRLTFGAGTDLSIYHNGSDSYIEDSGTGALVVKTSQLSIRNAADDEQLAKFIQDSSVELYHNNSKKIETTSTGVSITGNCNVDGNVTLSDNEEIQFGNSTDFRIFHDGSNSYIRDVGTGNLIIAGSAVNILNGAASESMLRCSENGAVELYHNNVKKFETHDVGTIFTEAGSGTTQSAIKVNTTLDTFGSVTVRDKSDVNDAVAAFQVENASNGANENNLLLRSVNLGTTAFAHGLYAAKSHRFAVSNNTTPKVQIDLDGLKFNNDQASDNALSDYEEGIHNPTDASGSSLTFSYPNSGRYTKIGRAVIVSFDIIFPTTSSGGLAAVSPPFTGGLNYGAGVCGWTDLGRPAQLHVSTSSVYLMDNNSGSGKQKHLTNAECSGKRFICNYTMQINE